MDKDAYLHKVVKSILSNERLTCENWRRIVLVAQFEGGSSRIGGYCFSEGGRHTAVSPRTPELLDLFEKLRAQMAKDDRKQPWAACLIRVDKQGEDAEIDAEFEYDNPNRWAVTPDNLKQQIAFFRSGL